ncbi:MAG: DUF2490 domain-containing protein [Cyclobacteriaceae bacterium]|nr:MAG: DUF2490 domain-containing protein [Cyclobacteriaceae bacterium]
MHLKKIFFLLLLTPVLSLAQKQTEYNEQTWFGYLSQTRLTNRSGIWLDLHFRLNDHFVKEPAIGMARLGYIFYVNDQNRLAAGYAYITQYSNSNGLPNVPEHRLWQQFQWFEKKKWLSIMQYVRLEERFRRKVEEGELVDEYTYTSRVRYAMAFTIPLKGEPGAPKTPFVFINNELMINFGSEIVNNYFDQNRFFVGLGYQFTKNLNASVGYLNVFQQLPAASTFRHVDGIRIFVFHNLDLRPDDR